MNSTNITSSKSMSLRQVAFIGCLLVTIVIGLVGAIEEERLRVEQRKPKESQDLAETINYLEGVDKYYSQLSRPRFGRSEYKQHASPSLADRVVGYRLATAVDALTPNRWAYDSSNVYQSGNQNGNRYTLSMNDLMRRRMAEQMAAPSYEQSY